MTESEIVASLRARREELEPLVEEYRRLVDADERLTKLFGPIRKPRAARKPRAKKSEYVDAGVPFDEPKQRVTLNVTTSAPVTRDEARLLRDGERSVAAVT